MMNTSNIYGLLVSTLISIILLACNAPKQSASVDQTDPQYWIDQAIEQHGGEKYSNSLVSFSFRDRGYTALHTGGAYEYHRIFEDEKLGKVKDILTNSSFVRQVNGEAAAVPDSMKIKYSNSVNSVIYFGLLPFKLNDPATIKSYLGTSMLKGKKYHKVEVRFEEDGGGKDFEDVFVYWIQHETKEMDYLAYSYKTDGGGIRFREGFNFRTVNGIRFADYVNYKADPAQYKVHELDKAFEEGKLKELSKIELEAIAVELVSDSATM